MNEKIPLKLVSDSLVELRNALSSLENKQEKGALEYYIFYTSLSICRALEGYVSLQENKLIEPSKLLIRTAIEAMIRIQAVHKKPELLFRIALTEFDEDRKWIQPSNESGTADILQKIEMNKREFIQGYLNEHPNYQPDCNTISLKDLADKANIGDYYDTHYRLYCRFTHSALRASIGALGELEYADNRTMTICAIGALDALVSLGATSPNMLSLKKRLQKGGDLTP